MGQLSTYSLKHDDTLAGIGTTTSTGETALVLDRVCPRLLLRDEHRLQHHQQLPGGPRLARPRWSPPWRPRQTPVRPTWRSAPMSATSTSKAERPVSVDVFRVGWNGSLTQIETVAGLPTLIEGIATIN